MDNVDSTFKEIKTRMVNWWVMLIIGLVFVAMGFYVFNNPVESYITLAIFFAAMMLVSGIFQVFFSVTNRAHIEGWGWQLALGLMETFIGVFLFSNVQVTMAILPFFVGFWLMFRSFALIGFSFELKAYQIKSWAYYLIFGILLGIFSWMIIINPMLGGLTIITWTGIAFFIAGIANIMLSFRLRKVKKKMLKLEDVL